MALLWDAMCAEHHVKVAALERRLQAAGMRRLAFSAEGVRVWVVAENGYFKAHLMARTAGVVLGAIFERHRDVLSDVPACAALFGERETRDVLTSQGRHLTSRYWGNYVALLVDIEAGERFVVKDPTGSLPCHTTQCDGIRILFSHLADCLELRTRPLGVNWTFVRRRIVNGMFEVESNPWEEVLSVHRGECVRFDVHGECSGRSFYWHPATFGAREAAIEDPDFAAGALRATVRSCVHTLAAGHPRVLQQTSGGLDSSIVLSALGDAPHRPEVTCYTDYSDGSPCDERRWARQAAAGGGHRHVELPFDAGAIRLAQLAPLAPSVYPPSSLAQWHRGPIERRLSDLYGASAAFTGDGGDATFCSTSYVLAVDHSLRRHGISRRTLAVAASVAARRDRTVWKVLGQALRRRFVGSGMRQHQLLMSSGLQLIHEDARPESANFPNPWFSQDVTVDVESIWRLGTLAYAPEFYDLSTSHRNAAPMTVSPLCAQPVFEVCRRIPVDVHFEGGKIRGLARRAFAGRVPEPILRRQWKDRPLAYPASIVQGNLDFIRETLLDGELCRARILDRAAVAAALDAAPSRQRTMAGELLGHLDIELWLRHSSSGVA